jgi:xanthine dehydrogenase accessory factor
MPERMKHWLETRQVLDCLADAHRSGDRAVLCTVVRVKGSAYRHEGAKLVVVEGGETTGNVSGGCLEQDVREVALQVMQSGRPKVRAYRSRSDPIAAWDLGVGCDGEVDILIEPAPGPRIEVRARLDRRTPFAVCTVLPGRLAPGAQEAGRLLIVDRQGVYGHLGANQLTAMATARALEALGAERSTIVQVGDRSVFVDSLIPPPQLVLFGAGDDAIPLARAGADVGFRVLVVDRGTGHLTAERFPGAAQLVGSREDRWLDRLALDDATYTVVMTHNFAEDQEFVRRLLPSPVPYIGLLGPRQRSQRILQNLSEEGVLNEPEQERLYGPVGLDIGADGAEQVGLSIIAEIMALRSGRSAGSLRERRVPIHAPDD